MADFAPAPFNPKPVFLEDSESANDGSLPEARPSTPAPTNPLTVFKPFDTDPTDPTEPTDPKTTNEESSRPTLHRRQSSETMIVPRDHPSLTTPNRAYPPRGPPPMSPPRPSDETEKLGINARLAAEEHAKSLQSGLTDLFEKIEVINKDLDNLERENRSLKVYIGEVTRSVSSSNMGLRKGKK